MNPLVAKTLKASGLVVIGDVDGSERVDVIPGASANAPGEAVTVADASAPLTDGAVAAIVGGVGGEPILTNGVISAQLGSMGQMAALCVDDGGYGGSRWGITINRAADGSQTVQVNRSDHEVPSQFLMTRRSFFEFNVIRNLAGAAIACAPEFARETSDAEDWWERASCELYTKSFGRFQDVAPRVGIEQTLRLPDKLAEDSLEVPVELANLAKEHPGVEAWSFADYSDEVHVKLAGQSDDGHYRALSSVEELDVDREILNAAVSRMESVFEDWRRDDIGDNDDIEVFAQMTASPSGEIAGLRIIADEWDWREVKTEWAIQPDGLLEIRTLKGVEVADRTSVRQEGHRKAARGMTR